MYVMAGAPSFRFCEIRGRGNVLVSADDSISK